MKRSFVVAVLLFTISFTYTFSILHFVTRDTFMYLVETMGNTVSRQYASIVLGIHEAEHIEPDVPQTETRSDLIEVIPTPISYVPAEMTWDQMIENAEWKSREHAASFIFNNRLWIVGGVGGDGSQSTRAGAVPYANATHFNDVWSSPDGVEWKLEVKEAPWTARRSMSVVTFKDKIWLIGGWSPKTGYMSDVWSSPDGVTWDKVLGLGPWSPREGQSVQVFDGKIWLMGGVNYEEKETKHDVWYTEDGVTWYEATREAKWHGRWGHATAVFNGRLYLIGGTDFDTIHFNDVWTTVDGIQWDLVTNTPPWHVIQGHHSFMYKDALWIAGRFEDGLGGTMGAAWYTLDGFIWDKTREDPEWLEREAYTFQQLGEHLYVLGGRDVKGAKKNDVWRLTVPQTAP